MNMYINMCILIIMYMSMSFTAIDYNNTISLMFLELWTLYIYMISKSKHTPRPYDQFITVFLFEPVLTNLIRPQPHPWSSRGSLSLPPYRWTLVSQICIFPFIDLGRVVEISNTYLYITSIYIVYIDTRSIWFFFSGRDPVRSHRSLIHCRLLCLLVYSF